MTRRAPPESLLTPILLAVFSAFGSGLLEAVYQALRRHLGRATLVSVDGAWMGPVGNLLWVALPLAGILLWWLLRPGRRNLAPVAGILGFVGFADLALMNGRFHWSASLLIAAGLAVQLSRWVARHPTGFTRFVWVGAGVLTALVVGLAVVLPWRRHAAERRALAALSAPPAGAPNVLLLIIDTARWYDFSLADSTSDGTPNLLRRAAEGTSFTRASSTAPWTLPSHASIFTGLWPFQTGADWKSPLSPRPPTLAGRLAARGYATGGFVANLAYCSREYGLARGFLHYEDFPHSLDEFVASTAIGRRLFESTGFRVLIGYHDPPGRRTAAEINGELTGWLDGLGDRPFFAFLNYFDVHEPYDAPPEYLEYFGSTAARRPDLWWHTQRGVARPNKEQMPPEELAAEHHAYRGALRYVDAQIEALLAELDRRGLLEKTLVIVTADHGEQFGEHGKFEHGNSFYPHVLHVPMIFRLPGQIPAGARVTTPVTSRDLAATILDLVAPGDTTGLPGRSLAGLWLPQADTTRHEVVYEDYHREDGKPAWAIRSDGYHYMHLPDGTEEIYDLQGDPLETANLVGGPRGDSLLTAFRARHDSVRAAARGAR